MAIVSCKSLQSCPTLCNPMGCSPEGSSVHGILQARILEWVAISFSRESSDPGIQSASPTSPTGKETGALHCRWILYHWATIFPLSVNRLTSPIKRHRVAEYILKTTKQKSNRMHILLKCTWNSFQDRVYVRPQSLHKFYRIEIISSILSKYKDSKIKIIWRNLGTLQLCGV